MPTVCSSFLVFVWLTHLKNNNNNNDNNKKKNCYQNGPVIK